MGLFGSLVGWLVGWMVGKDDRMGYCIVYIGDNGLMGEWVIRN